MLTIAVAAAELGGCVIAGAPTQLESRATGLSTGASTGARVCGGLIASPLTLREAEDFIGPHRTQNVRSWLCRSQSTKEEQSAKNQEIHLERKLGLF